MLPIKQAKQYTLEYLLEGEKSLLDASKKNSTFNKQYADSLFSQKNVLKNMREAEKAIQKAEKIFSLDEAEPQESPQTERQSIYAAYFTSQRNTKKKTEEKESYFDESVSLKEGYTHRLGERIFNSKSLGSSQQHIQLKRMQSTGRLLETERKGSEGSLLTSSFGFQPFARERDSLGFIVNPKSEYTKEAIEQFHEKLPNMPSERQHISLIVRPSKDNILVLRKGVHFFEKGTQLKSRRREDQLIQNVFPCQSSTFRESKGLSFKEDKLVKQSLNEKQEQGQSKNQTNENWKLHTETSCKTLTLTDQLTTARQYYPLTLETAADTPDSQNIPQHKQNFQKQQQKPSNNNQINHILDAESDLKQQFLPSLQPQTSRSRFSKDEDIHSRIEMEQQDDPYKLKQKTNISNQRVHSTENNNIASSQEHAVSLQTLMESGVFHGNCHDPNCARNHKNYPQNTEETKRTSFQAPQRSIESTSSHHIIQVNMKQKGKNAAPINLGKFSTEPSASETKIKLPDRNNEQPKHHPSETNTPKKESMLNMRFKWQMNALDQALIFEQVRKTPSASQQQSSYLRLRLLKPPTEDLSLFGSTPNPSPCNYHPRYESVEKRTRDVIFDKAKVSDSSNPLFSTPIYKKEPPLTLEQQETLNKLAVQPVQVNKEEGYEVMFSEMMKEIKNEVRAQKILHKELQHPMKGLMLTPIPHPDIEELNKEIGGKLNYCKQCLSNLKYYLKADHPQIIRKQKIKQKRENYNQDLFGWFDF